MLNIRRLSQLLGISTQTIRLYEQHGIFCAVRSESNNYRKFDRRAIATLMKCRKLMGMGFSIKQIVEISKGVTYQVGQRMLKQQADEIEKEIRLLVGKDDPMLQKWNEYSFIRHDVKRFPKAALLENNEPDCFTMEYCAWVEEGTGVELDVSKAYRVEQKTVLMAYATCPVNQMKLIL